jgi:acylphosphatase
VRNREDGRVEAVFEGDPDAVNIARQLGAARPARAEVTAIDVHDETPENESGSASADVHPI